MASSSIATRSQLIDYTYQHVNTLLSGHREGLSPDQIVTILESRLDKFRKISEPFGAVSDASKTKLQSGTVALPDGVSIEVEEADKEVVIAISKKFNIDETDALTLLRSFLYNEGLPSVSDSDAMPSLIEEVINMFTPFYFSERLSVYRVLISLLRARETIEDPFHDYAADLLSKIFKDGSSFTDSILSEYLQKTRAQVPENFANNPRLSAQWAKQNMKEQLGLLEVMFWLLWDYVPCYATIVVRIFEVAYQTQLGNNQENSTLMLDEEGMQLQRDISAFWVILVIEILNLEQVLDPGLDISPDASEQNKLLLQNSPASLEKIHQLVLSNTHPGYVCIFLAWAFYLKGVSVATAELKDAASFEQFLKEIGSKHGNSNTKHEEQIHHSMVSAAIRPESGLFEMLTNFLTSSPLFVTTIAWKTGSTITDPNAVAYRSVLKGLIISIVEYQPIEYLPDFEGLVEVWIALFGNSESSSVSKLCRQYWDHDWRQNAARRAIIDIARSRFPIQLRPLIRLLHAMTGSGSMGLFEVESLFDSSSVDVDRQQCSAYVFHYFRTLPTYTQMLSASARTGANALYDRVVERRGPSSSGGVAYTNLKPIKLPGGSIIPSRSVGRLLSSDSSTEAVLVAWQHQHSGWNVLVDVLVDYMRRRQGASFGRNGGDTDFSRRSEQPVLLYLEEIGIEITGDYDDVVCDILELIFSIIQENPIQTAALMECLEEGDSVVPHTTRDATRPDLVQLVIMILEDALSRPQQNPSLQNSPVAPAISILSALLSLPDHSNRVWLYLRSTSVLFGADRTSRFTTSILEAERMSGHYTTTLALLQLVRRLLEEAISSLLMTSAEQPRMQTIKDEVLLRALRFIHGEIWLEYSSWRYARLSDRFVLGRCVIDVFSRILETNSALTSASAFTGITSFILQTLISHASISTINPLVYGMAAGATILSTLRGLRRHTEIRHLGLFLESCLYLIRAILYAKASLPDSSNLCLLEQTLCTEITLGKTRGRSGTSRTNPIDVLANYVRERGFGPKVPINAVRALTALCLSLSACSNSSPTIIGHLWDPPAVATNFVRIVQHPYEDLPLRYALWDFICVSIGKEPALAALFVHGQFRIPSMKGKGKAKGNSEESKTDGTSEVTGSKASAVEAACSLLAIRKELWESNPQLLACAVKFLHVVWQHGREHKVVLDPLRSDNEFWQRMSSLAMEELGPVPDYLTSDCVETEDGERADVHQPVSMHAYRTTAKSYALRVIGSDISLRKSDSTAKPASYIALESFLKSGEVFTDSIAECISTSFDPELQDRISHSIQESFAPLTVDILRSQELLSVQEYGDNFMFSISLLRDLVDSPVESREGMVKTRELRYFIYSLNLNFSLSHAQAILLDAWTFLLGHIKGFLRSEQKLRDQVISIIVPVARDISSEKRSGDMMTTIHRQRLALLLALFEIAWLQEKLPVTQTNNFMQIIDYMEGIISSEAFPPQKSFIRALTTSFHQTLLKILYLVARSCRVLFQNQRDLRSEHRLMIDQMLFSALTLVIDALRVTFDAANMQLNVEIDEDMELLVAVLEQCVKAGLHISSGAWLTRCQEIDIIGASFTLLDKLDLVGLSDPSVNRERGRPMYAESILLFHMALATVPYGAERVASAGIVAAYCNTSISSALNAGSIETTIPELTGERNPAHRAYCQMLFNMTSILNSLINPQQFVESQVVGLVQMFGQQISKALSWTNEDPITLAALDELELSVDIFYLMISGSTSSSRSQGPLAVICRSYTEHGLQLLQHLNYALTHPRHLAGLLEPITAEERTQIEKETADVSVNTLKELLDPKTRPLLVRVIRRLFHVTSQVLSTLNIISDAEKVLISDSEEWLLQEALVVPHSKVSVREPASIGTLLELGNCAFDILRYLANSDMPTARVAGAQPASDAWQKSDKKSNIRTARRTLETVLTYTATQLVMWLMKHDGEQFGELDTEEQQLHLHNLNEFGLKTDGGGNKDRDHRRSKRRSISMADRLTRGMTGEMLVDLQTLISRAKPVVARSIEISDTECVDILPALARFLDERAPA